MHLSPFPQALPWSRPPPPWWPPDQHPGCTASVFSVPSSPPVLPTASRGIIVSHIVLAKNLVQVATY